MGAPVVSGQSVVAEQYPVYRKEKSISVLEMTHMLNTKDLSTVFDLEVSVLEKLTVVVIATASIVLTRVTT